MQIHLAASLVSQVAGHDSIPILWSELQRGAMNSAGS